MRCMGIAAVVAVLLSACETEAPHLALAPEYSATDADEEQYSNWADAVNLGPPVNTAFIDAQPFLSKDGLSLYFVSSPGRGGSGLRDIWVSGRASTDDSWGSPRNLGPVINSAAQDGHPTLSADGHRLYFASDRPGGAGGFDLYVSRRRDNRDNLGWETPVNLGTGINSSADETGLTIFEGVAYFDSNRPGGAGGADIYAIRLEAAATVGPAVLVDELSTSADDLRPAIRRDGEELFLASNRLGSLGGLDLWVATRATTSGPWSTPINLGPGVNSAFPDDRPALSFRETELYFQSAFRPDNIGGPNFDIWVTRRAKLKDF